MGLIPNFGEAPAAVWSQALLPALPAHSQVSMGNAGVGTCIHGDAVQGAGTPVAPGTVTWTSRGPRWHRGW